MIDTIKGYQDLEGNTQSLDHFIINLEGSKILKDTNNGMGFVKGSLNNFKISIRYSLLDKSINRISFEGSIPKFLYGNNLASCSPSDVELVLNSLSDILEIPLDDAKITRIDFGVNFLVKYPVSVYMKAIQEFPRHKRVVEGRESVSFRIKSNTKEITFYDKILEMQKDKKSRQALSTIPDFIKEINILRYEVKSLRGHSIIPRLKNLTFIDVCTSETFNYLYEVLVATFNKVNIVDIEIPSKILVSRNGWLKNFLALIGLREYGLNETFNLIDSIDYDVEDPGQKRSNLKRSIRELTSQYNNLHSISIKRELEAKLGALYGILL